MTTPDLAPTPGMPAGPTGSPSAAPKAGGPKPMTHPCVRCGAPVPLDVGLCERCNPLGLRDSSASQVHGTVFIAVLLGVVGLALLARLTISGVGPFDAKIASLAPAADGTGLAVTLTVHNTGTGAGQTTCRLTDPQDRNGNKGAFILSPQIDPGGTRTFSQTVTEFGTTPRDLFLECSNP